MWYPHRVTTRRKVCIPGKEPLDFPASAVAAQLAPVLGPALPVGAVGLKWRDYLEDYPFKTASPIKCGREQPSTVTKV
jgi:hypothetical protein